jgi:hypothetical protein
MEDASLTAPDLPHLREPVRGGVAYPGLAAIPGVEQVEAFLAGRAPAPPVARLTGRQIIGASFGSATYALRATGWSVQGGSCTRACSLSSQTHR